MTTRPAVAASYALAHYVAGRTVSLRFRGYGVRGTDQGTVPDLDVLTGGIVTSLDELAALAHTTSAAR
jgi:hypothetical protein